MKTGLFEVFIKMIDGLPANAILMVAELEGQMIRDDFSQGRILTMQEAVSVLDFCRFLQAVVRGSGIFPTVLPVDHVASYRKTVNRLIEAGELPFNASEQFDKTFLSICSTNKWRFGFNNEAVKREFGWIHKTAMAA
jgi:hypothetical protein